MKEDKVIPRLQLAVQQASGGVKSTGPHKLKKIADKVEEAWDENAKAKVKTVKVLVEENGEQKKWIFPYYDKSGEVDYKAIRLSEIENGETMVVEVKAGKNGRNYTSISRSDEIPDIQIDDSEGGIGEVESSVSSGEIPF